MYMYIYIYIYISGEVVDPQRNISGYQKKYYILSWAWARVRRAHSIREPRDGQQTNNQISIE